MFKRMYKKYRKGIESNQNLINNKKLKSSKSILYLLYSIMFLIDSCFRRGHKSPCNHLQSLAKPIPNLTPAEQQYESYVRATVAANSKCPVEDVVVVIPPAPPPRRFNAIQHLTPHISNSMHPTTNDTITASTISIGTTVDSTTRNGLADYSSSATTSCLTSPNYTITDAGVSSPDAQALCQIREQMALSLSRMKDLEEQVKLIPSLQVTFYFLFKCILNSVFIAFIVSFRLYFVINLIF